MSASVRAVESLKQRLDRGEEVDLEQEAEVSTVASLLKLYLRELPEGLVHSSIHGTLIQLYNGEQHIQPGSQPNGSRTAEQLIPSYRRVIPRLSGMLCDSCHWGEKKPGEQQVCQIRCFNQSGMKHRMIQDMML